MLSLSPSMQAKLDQRATTFCHCWRIARSDATVLGFTDHDRDLTFNGVTFRANTGLSASQLESSVGFAPIVLKNSTLPHAMARDSLSLLICRRSGDDGDSDSSRSVFL